MADTDHRYTDVGLLGRGDTSRERTQELEPKKNEQPNNSGMVEWKTCILHPFYKQKQKNNVSKWRSRLPQQELKQILKLKQGEKQIYKLKELKAQEGGWVAGGGGAGGDDSRRRPPSVSGPGLLHAVVGLRRRHVRRLGEEVLVELCHEPGG